MARLLPLSEWNRLPIARIEDLRDAVHGAGLEATQMTRGEISGGIAFAETGGMVFTSGLIEGRTAILTIAAQFARRCDRYGSERPVELIGQDVMAFSALFGDQRLYGRS